MNHDHYYSKIRKNVLTSMILVPVIPFLLILGIGYYYFTTSLEANTISGMKRVVDDHRQMIDSFLRERKGDLEFILHSYAFEYLGAPHKLSEVFGRLQKQSNAFVDLGVFDEEGVHVAYQGPFRLTGRVYKEADWFKAVIRDGYYMSDIFLGYRRIPHFVIALAKEEQGKKWVIRATIDTYMFNNLVKKVRIGKTGEAYIVNKKGIFQTERRSGGNLMGKDPDNLKYPAKQSGINTFIEKDAKGERYLYATTRLRDKDWLLVVRQEKSDAFSALRRAAYWIVLISLLGGGAIMTTAFYLTNHIVKRIERADAEKDQLGEQLIRAGRLAELGEMAAGFAHEINNPLQIIKSEQALCETVLSDLKDRGELRESEDLTELEESINQMAVQVDRCAEITQAILKFGRKSEPVFQGMDLREFIPEIIMMVEKKASVHGIAIEENISQDVLPVHGDPSQLQQVLLNLLNNALDAVLAKHGASGGELVIKARNQEEGKVRIQLMDNGRGISPENMKRIFTPFFTTKPVGQGTGLGLSICFGIIESMGGVLDVVSEKGIGTTFTIILPAAG